MYCGSSCPVISLYRNVGIVFILIYKREETQRLNMPTYVWLCVFTSPIAVAKISIIFSWGKSTVLWPLISIIRWPTRTPPRSAILPRRILTIFRHNQRDREHYNWMYELYMWLSIAHSSVLNTEAETVFHIWSNHHHLYDRWTRNNSEFDLLQTTTVLTIEEEENIRARAIKLRHTWTRNNN